MRDEEVVLRFLALQDGLAAYRPPMVQFLNGYMRRHGEAAPSDEVVEQFRRTMHAIGVVFGGAAFHSLRGTMTSPNLNRALYDAVSMGFLHSDQRQILEKSVEVRRMHRALLMDDAFVPLAGRAAAERVHMTGRVRTYAGQLADLGIEIFLPELPGE